MQKIYLFVLFCLSFTLSKAQVNLGLGLAAYYPFTGNANDVSGNNNNPSFNNATLTTDRFGNLNSAYHFDGTDNYIQIPNSPSINFGTTMSICVWVRPTGFYMGACYNNMLLGKEVGDFQTGNYSLRFANFAAGCGFSGTADDVFGNEPDGGQSVTPVQLNQWYSVVFTSDGTTAKLYVNCQLVSSSAVTVTTYTNPYDLFFGHLNDATFPYWLNGDLDEIRLYNRAINQDEVNAYGGCPTTCTPTSSTIDTTICQGQAFNGHTTTGAYVDTLINVQGCDSLRTVNLTVNNNCSIPCNNWLSTSTVNDYVTVGDLNVVGNQLTVEATFNRTLPPSPPGSYGFLVSKHTNATDNNYSLFPNGCALTTVNNGEVFALQNCPIELNKTYHVAMVYDGASLKFYRDGYLISQTPATGNLINNSLTTTIAQNPQAPIFPFLGDMNEVRIWDVARTQSEIRAYMNSSLPNPTTQTGLLGYYTFNSLVNQQGNAAFNGTIHGAALVNQTNPNCTFVLDSCCSPTSSTIDTTICQGQSYLGHSTTGAYIDTLTNAKGCDSIRTINLTVNNNCIPVPCNVTNSLIINTGYNTITNTVLPVGQEDTNWRVTYLSAPLLSVTGEVAVGKGTWTIAPVVGYWATNANSSYITGVNNGTNGYNTTYMGDYTVTETRTFKTLLPDNITFNLNIAADNYISALSIDGGPNLLTGPPNYSLSFVPYTFTDFLPAGSHTISITLVNATSDMAYTHNDNYSGLNVYGTISGSTGVNSIMAPGSAANCIYAASYCDTTLWRARTTSNSSCCGGINCTSGWLNASQFIGNGVAHVPTNLSCDPTYYYSELEMTDTMCITNNFTYEIRLRNPASGGGIDSYDVGISLTGSGINTGCQLIGSNGINGPVWAQQFTSAFAGTNTVTNNPALVMNFDNWHIISLAYKNNVLHYSLDGVEFFQLPYTGNICNIEALGILFKGSGEIDWTRILDANGNQVWREDFDSCVALKPFPPCATIAPVVTLSYVPPTCSNDTLQLIGSADQLISYSWTGPNGFTSTDQNPKIAVPTTAVNGIYTVTGSTNNCSPAITTHTLTVSITPPAPTLSTLDTTICQGQSLRSHTTTGNYKDTIPNAAGCDSIITLNLTVIQKSFSIKDTSICQGQSFRGHTTTGSFIDTIPNVAGCDSIMTLNLTIRSKSFSTITTSICQGQNYLGYTTTGAHADTLVAANGCDSIRTINLTVIPYSHSTINKSICQGNSYLGYTNTGTFVDTLFNAAASGCDSIRTINLTVKAKTFAIITTAICQGQSYLGNTATGNYTDTIPNAAGCDSIITLHLTVNPLPIVKTNNDTTICKGTSFQVNTTGAITYSWSPSTGLAFPDNTSDPIINTTTPIRYIVTGIANNCPASDTLNIGINPIPVVYKSNDVTICKDSSTRIYANGGLGFQWSPNSSLVFDNYINDPIASPLVTTIYHVVVTDVNDCSNSDSIKVSVRPPAIFSISPDAGACANIPTQLLASGGNTYLWSPASLVSDPAIRNPTTSITSSTTYSVLIKENTCGTSANLSTTLTLLPGLSISANKSNDLDCYTSSATLSATGADQYIWSPATGLNNVNVAEPIAKPFATQKYIVKGTDADGCFGFDSVTVFGNYTDRLVYNMANAFSPNNDGVNDCYGIKYFGVISDFTFMIFNRWGQQMFSTNDPSACWDGTFQGQNAPIGTYVYYIRAITACGTTEKKGTVVLIR
jgi:gliding motility-associated-like protein